MASLPSRTSSGQTASSDRGPLLRGAFQVSRSVASPDTGMLCSDSIIGVCVSIRQLFVWGVCWCAAQAQTQPAAGDQALSLSRAAL